MFEASAKVIYNRKIKKGYFEIALSAPKIAGNALPGQFVNIRVSGGLEPLLRRPLSIHRVRGNKIFLLYEVFGKGTEMLSEKKAGEYLDIIGPLGAGFSLHITHYTSHILVAGGMGTAPLIFLAEKLAEIKNQKSKIKTLVLIGARTKKDILCEDEFRKLGCEVKIATDNGSRGFKGYVSELLTQELSTIDYFGQAQGPPPLTAVYACGPKLLLKEISRISFENDIPAQLSLESHMACGIGACMGCMIKVKSQKSPAKAGSRRMLSNGREKAKSDFEYKRVCKEGPVFAAREIIW